MLDVVATWIHGCSTTILFAEVVSFIDFDEAGYVYITRVAGDTQIQADNVQIIIYLVRMISPKREICTSMNDNRTIKQHSSNSW